MAEFELLSRFRDKIHFWVKSAIQNKTQFRNLQKFNFPHFK